MEGVDSLSRMLMSIVGRPFYSPTANTVSVDNPTKVKGLIQNLIWSGYDELATKSREKVE